MSQYNWVEEVLNECRHVETPRSWLHWSLLSAISAAAGNNYFLVALKGALVVKPNIYTILLGESGLGKEFPISLSSELVSRANVTRVIAGRSSIQAIVKELSMARTREGKPPIMDSRAYIVNGELSTAIISDPDSLTILTDLYDRKTQWTNLLKGDGAEQLKNPYVTALFGSSPAHFYDSIPQVNIEGGYIGRNFVVYEEKLHHQEDLLGENQEAEANEFPYEKFVPFLEKVNAQEGRIIVDNDARIYFNNWRRDWRENQRADTTGFAPRVPVHALKVAMCLCLAQKNGLDKLEINQGQMEEAVEKVTAISYGVRKATEGSGEDPLSKVTKKILDYLVRADGNQLTRKQLLVKGYGNYQAPVLDQVLDNLLEVGWITRTRTFAGKNSDWVIKLCGRPLEEYKEFLKRQEKISKLKEAK